MAIRLSRLLLALAAVLMAAAVGLGAYASHGLAARVDADALHAFETAVTYQLVHALGVMIAALCIERFLFPRTLALAATLLLVGILLFCGGVYSSSLDGPRWISELAPTGGIGLIAGWLVFAFAMIRELVGDTR